MITALKSAVSTNGTAAKARLENYTVAGKTGTAQKAGITGYNRDGKPIINYLPGKYFSSFIGFFPADNPEVLIAVMMDEPKQGYYGGAVSGPIFKAIAQRVANYLAIPPETISDLSGAVQAAHSRASTVKVN